MEDIQHVLLVLWSQSWKIFILSQDGRIDYNEFVAMMQKGNPVLGGGKKGLEQSFSIGFREALKL